MDSLRNKIIDWNALSTVESFDRGSKEDEICGSTELISGELMRRSIPTVTTPISLLVQSLIQQLCTMLEKDHNRASKLYNTICEKLYRMKLLDDTYSMGEFEIMRCQYQIALQQLVKVASGPELPILHHNIWPLPSSSGLEWSRYYQEFEEILFIANGGFGKVFKVRHRLDGVVYAVKKIFIRSCDLNSVLHHLAEVKTLAGLDHPNIVSYKSAWLEPLLETPNSHDLGTGNNQDLDKSTYTDDTDSSSYLSRNTRSDLTNNCTDESDSEICFEESGEIVQIKTTQSQQRVAVAASSEDCKALCKIESKNALSRFTEVSHINLKWATLFIQMSLCQKTLKDWLEERDNMTLPSPDCGSQPFCPPGSDRTDCLDSPCSLNSYMGSVVDIFTQLSKGLHYIHSCRIIHHDIKPSNVFICSNGTANTVQLGDFGLACPLQKSHKGVALGTPLYAAPEQLQGECNIKSDLYSMGIILLEMIEMFRTNMEKAKRLQDLRNGHVPSHVTANYPKLAHIIGRLVQTLPNKRIDTSQLLQMIHGLAESKDSIIKSLQEELRNVRSELNAKDNTLIAKDMEIERLKLLLKNSDNSK